MANEKMVCNQICRWNALNDGCMLPAHEICPLANTEPDASGWGQVQENKKRLIDANALLEEIQFRRPVIDTETKIVADCVEIARKAIVNAPTVDAVEVVRCGKCRHWVPEDSRKDYGVCHRFGNKRGIWRRADGYCDKGEQGDCRRGREEGTERVS